MIIDELRARILREFPTPQQQVAREALDHFERKLMGEVIGLVGEIPFVGQAIAGGIGWISIRAYQAGYEHGRKIGVDESRRGK
jgi:hypothetical protein